MPSRCRLLALLGCFCASSSLASEPRISIIIDDLGYAWEAGRRTIELPAPVVCAILPQTPHGSRLATLAHGSGKDVLLHLPMQAVEPSPRAEPGAIGLDTTRGGFARAFAENLDSVPYAIGINGHRGSLLTRHPGHMRWLMEEVGSRDLLFIDSYTTHRSIALSIAAEHGIVATRRDVFLDNDPSPTAIAAEFERLIALAQTDGSAVAIGHPYPATLAFLEERLPLLASEGIELVGIAELLGHQQAAAQTTDTPGTGPAFATSATGVEPVPP